MGAFLLTCLTAVGVSAQGLTSFYYTGSPVSYVARGQTATLTPTDGVAFSATVGVHFYGDPSPDYVNIEMFNKSNSQIWSVSFAVPQGQPIVPGTYLNATRYGFEDPSMPGLEFDANSAGNNTLSGYFKILEATITNGKLISFAADFTQYDEMAQASWVYGSIRYNSSVPLNVLPPVPVQPLSVACTNASGPLVLSVIYTYSSTCLAGGGVGPYTWSFANLPSTMKAQTLSPPGPGSITITGQPASPGPFNYTVKVTDSQNNTASQNFSGTTVAGSCQPRGTFRTIGQSYEFPPSGGTAFLSFTFISEGCPWTISSDIPGLRFAPAGGTTNSFQGNLNSFVTVPPNTGSSLLTGNIFLMESGNVSMKFPVVVNSNSCSYAINPSTAHFGVVGGSGSFTLTASPSGCIAFPAASNISVSQVNGAYYYGIPPNAGAAVQGTVQFGAAPGSAGATFNWQQDGGDGSLLMSCYPLGPSQTGATLATCSAAGGTPPYNWSVIDGTVPGGVSPFLAVSNGSRVTFGNASAPGPYHFTVKVTDSATPTAAVTSYAVAGTVVPSTPQIACSAANGPRQAAVVYSTVCVPSLGTPPYQWSISAGSLPAGLSLTVSDSGVATISGVAASVGGYSYTLQLTDSSNPALNAAQTFTGTTTAAGSTQAAFAMTCSASIGNYQIGAVMQPIGCSVSGGTPPFTWSVHTGEMPPGMAFSSTTGSGITISGTPAEAVVGGYFDFYVKVTDSSAVPQPLLWSLMLEVAGPPTFSCSPVTGEVGKSYFAACTGANGAQVSAGVLPPGLVLAGNEIQGTPTTPGTYNFTLTQGNGTYLDAETVSNSYSIAIGPALPALNPANVVGSISHLALGDGWDTTTVLVNPADTFTQANVSFLGDSGAPLTLPQMLTPANVSANSTSTGVQTIPAHGSSQILSSGTGVSPVETGSARLSASAAMGGFLRYSYRSNGQEVNVPLETRNAPAYVLSFDTTNQISTGVAVANLSTSAANIDIIVRDDSGGQIGTGTVTLPPMGHQSFQLTSVVPAAANATGTVEVDTPENGQIAVLGIRAPATLHFTSIPVAATTDPGSGIISQLAVGGGWNTVFEIVNTNATPSQASLRFNKSDGTAQVLPLTSAAGSTMSSTWSGTVPAHGRVVLTSTGSDSGPVQIGSAYLASAQGVSGFIRYAYTPLNQELVSPLETQAAGTYAIAFDNTQGAVTAVAVANPGSAAVSIPVTIYNPSGILLGARTLALPANGQAAYLLTDAYSETRNQQGIVQFASPPGESLGVLGIRYPASGAFTTIPPVAQ